MESDFQVGMLERGKRRHISRVIYSLEDLIKSNVTINKATKTMIFLCMIRVLPVILYDVYCIIFMYDTIIYAGEILFL